MTEHREIIMQGSDSLKPITIRNGFGLVGRIEALKIERVIQDARQRLEELETAHNTLNTEFSEMAERIASRPLSDQVVKRIKNDKCLGRQYH